MALYIGIDIISKYLGYRSPMYYRRDEDIYRPLAYHEINDRGDIRITHDFYARLRASWSARHHRRAARGEAAPTIPWIEDYLATIPVADRGR
jgi:hypothetical protein